VRKTKKKVDVGMKQFCMIWYFQLFQSLEGWKSYRGKVVEKMTKKQLLKIVEKYM
jgi:hypothetical protein